MDFVTSKKGKRILIIFVMALIVIALLLAIVLSGNKEGYRTIKVSEISGKVGVVNNGIEYEAYPGMILKEGYAIVTSSDGYVRMVLDGDKYIKLEGGSRIVFEKLGILGSGKTTINLERGTITNEIVHPLSVDEEYVVNTPNAVLAVRGTFFRVSLKTTEEGDATTDVHTYGGMVASKRIMPDGNIVDEEVVVASGYMTTVKRVDEETIYVVESEDGEKENIAPIVKEMISDEDLIDIYFASENGHEMFIKKEEIEEVIKEREINIKEYSSAYEKAESLERENAVTSPDDGEPLVKNTDVQAIAQSNGVLSDGVHKHNRKETIEKATCVQDGLRIISCGDCGEEILREVIPKLGHKKTTVQVAATCTKDGVVVSSCTECGVEFSRAVVPKMGHKETIVQVAATCTKDGATISSCAECGVEFSKDVIPKTGHIHEVDGGTSDSHIQCADCGTILSSSHSYTNTITKQPTCTTEGERKFSCACGYGYIEKIAAKGHTEIYGGKEESHMECSTCSEVLDADHVYTANVIMEADCFDMGMIHYTCDCGWDYTETTEAKGHTEGPPVVVVEATCETDGEAEISCVRCGNFIRSETIPATGHTKSDEGGSQTTCANCGCSMVDFNSVNFPDTSFRNLLKNDNIDANMDGVLVGEELTNVTSLQYIDMGIQDATGVEYFTELKSLNLYQNPVSVVPIENLTKLTYINLGDSNITSFDATKYPDLTALDLVRTQISTLDLSNNPELRILNLAGCSSITTLDLSNNSALETAELQYTGLTELSIDGNSSLKSLSLNCAALETISVTDCVNLEILNLPNEQTNVLNSIDITGCTSLKSLNMNYVASTLKTFIADSSGLEGELELGNFQVLETVSLNNCASLVGLHVMNAPLVTSLSIQNSGLAYANLSGCYGLTAPVVSGNRYVVETNNSWVDMSGVLYFYGAQVLVDGIAGGTFADTVFNFDTESSEITYIYDMGNSWTAEFKVVIVGY